MRTVLTFDRLCCSSAQRPARALPLSSSSGVAVAAASAAAPFTMAHAVVEIKCEETLAFYMVCRHTQRTKGKERAQSGTDGCACWRRKSSSVTSLCAVCRLPFASSFQGYVKDLDGDMALVAYEDGYVHRRQLRGRGFARIVPVPGD
jgi:hypothetical protein